MNAPLRNWPKSLGPRPKYSDRPAGRFTPTPRPGMMFPELGITDEEMERRLNDPDAKWVTADEVMARLRELRGAK